jgi:hypothetical protein
VTANDESVEQFTFGQRAKNGCWKLATGNWKPASFNAVPPKQKRIGIYLEWIAQELQRLIQKKIKRVFNKYKKFNA